MAKEKIATAYRLLSMGLSEAQVSTHRASTGGNSENEGIRRDYQAALEHIGSRLFCMPLRYANL